MAIASKLALLNINVNRIDIWNLHYYLIFIFQSAQFYKVTTEQYQKAADEVSARFK